MTVPQPSQAAHKKLACVTSCKLHSWPSFRLPANGPGGSQRAKEAGAPWRSRAPGRAFPRRKAAGPEGGLFLSEAGAESESGSSQDGGGTGWECGREDGTRGGGDQDTGGGDPGRANGAGEGAPPALQHPRLLLKLPTPTRSCLACSSCSPTGDCCFSNCRWGLKGRLFLESPVPTF